MVASLLDGLGITRKTHKEFTLADGTKKIYGIGEAQFGIQSEERICPVDKDVKLLGAVSLEIWLGHFQSRTYSNPNFASDRVALTT